MARRNIISVDLIDDELYALVRAKRISGTSASHVMRKALCEWVGYELPVTYMKIQDNGVESAGGGLGMDGASAVLTTDVAATEGE